MVSTAFIICPIFAGVLISVHPIFSVPFIIVAFLISSKWQPSSEGGIIFGIILFFVIVTAVTLIAKAMGYPNPHNKRRPLYDHSYRFLD